MLQLAPSPPRVANSLADTYRRLTGICGTLRVHVLAPGPESATPGHGWARISELGDSVEALVDAEAVRIAAAHGCAPRVHVAASRLLHHYLWSACLLMSGPWHLAGQVPLLLPEEVWIEVATGDLAVRPGSSVGSGSSAGVGSVGSGEAGLRAAVAEHVEPVLAAFQPYVKRGPRAMWGMVTDDLISGIWYLGRMLGEEERSVRAAAAVLPGDTPPFPGAADFRRLPGAGGADHPTRTRLGCCLYYAIRPADTCLTCPRTDDAERVRRLDAQ